MHQFPYIDIYKIVFVLSPHSSNKLYNTLQKTEPKKQKNRSLLLINRLFRSTPTILYTHGIIDGLYGFINNDGNKTNLQKANQNIVETDKINSNCSPENKCVLHPMN